jgi:hypothetical protein
VSKNTQAIVVVIILVIGLIGGGYYFWQQNQPKPQTQNTNRTARANAKTFDHEVGKLKTDCPKVEICGNIDQDVESYKKVFPVAENVQARPQNNQGGNGGQGRQNLTQAEQDKADADRKLRRPYLDKFASFCRQAHPDFADNKKFNASGNIARDDKTKFSCRFWEN